MLLRFVEWLAPVLALLCVACEASVPAVNLCAPQPDPDGRVGWRGADGRTVLWRGVNVSGSAKRAADSLPQLADDDYAHIASWGMTAVRLLVFWEAIEPRRGEYDDAYLAAVHAQVARAKDAGLAVIVDMHQDLFGSGFGGKGLPRWACDEALYASYQQPASWFLGYFTKEVTSCFDRFWESQELQEAYADAVRRLADELENEPAFLGIELMNEPFWGSQRNFEPQVLAPFYRRVVDRAELASRVRIVAEPSVARNAGLATELPPPFGCGSRPWVYAPHYYPAYTEDGTGYDGDAAAIAAAFSTFVDEAKHLVAPVAVTEVGIRNDAPLADAYLHAVLDAADASLASVFVWDFDRGADGGFALLFADGSERPLVSSLIRAYLHKVAGWPKGEHWDALGRILVASWTSADEVVGEPTEFLAPARLYPTGVVVTSSDDAGHWHYEVDGQRVRVWADAGVPEHTVTLAPAP